MYIDEVKKAVDVFCQYISGVLGKASPVKEYGYDKQWTSFSVSKSIEHVSDISTFNVYNIIVTIQPTRHKMNQFQPTITFNKKLIVLEIKNFKHRIDMNTIDTINDELLQLLFLNETPEIRNIMHLYINSINQIDYIKYKYKDKSNVG